MAEDEVQGPSSELDRLGLKQEEAGRQVRTEPCVRWGLQRDLRRDCLWPACVDLEGKTGFLYLSFLLVLATVSTSVNG